MKNKIDKQALRVKIQGLQGLSNDDKSQLLTLLVEQKKYGLVWEDSKEEAEEMLRDNIPVLREVPERRILSKDTFMGQETEEESPNHILIEGDNLHALTALTYTHEGKIDVIYIDPPYNTGHKDFSYNDDFVNSDDSFRHSKWLSFMERRLKTAKRLLSDSGVIFISIDDNEFADLKLLCDEIFGINNFVANVVQKSRDSISGDLLFSPNHNYLLVYASSFERLFQRKDSFRIPTIVDETKFKNPDNDPRGPWKLSPVDGPGGARKGNPYYEFLGVEMYFRYSKDMMQKYYEDGLIVKRKSSLGKKYFLSQALAKNGEPPTTWWDDAGTTTLGTKLLKDIVPEKEFTNPKPVNLIVRCLQLASIKKSVILDFFAGSGTTLHATMQLNSEDGGHRQCILVTNNENNICEEVTYERNKRVIQGYTTPKGQQIPGLKNNNLRYYQMDFIPREQSTANKHALMNAATDLLCIKEDLYDEVKPFAGLKFKSSVLRYFKKDNKQMLMIYNERAVQYVVPKIKEVATKDSPIKIYVFSEGAYAYDDEFHEVKDLVELCALPDAIYQAYMRVLPPKRYEDEKLAMGEDAEDALNDDYEYNTKEGGMA